MAEHKSIFFSEKDIDGNKIDYYKAAAGELRLIPQGKSLEALEQDYAAMLADGLLPFEQPSFKAVMAGCAAIQDKINRLGRQGVLVNA